MIKIKYNNGSSLVPCEFARPQEHVVHLIGLDVVNKSGFIAYDEDGTFLGDYSSFTTVYRILPNGIQYSDDGSVYTPTTETLTFTADITETEKYPFVDEVSIQLVNSFGNTKEITLKKNKNWTYTLEADVEEHWFIESAEDVENYDCTIYDRTTVKYTWKAPTWAEIMEAQITYTALMTDTLIKEE